MRDLAFGAQPLLMSLSFRSLCAYCSHHFQSDAETSELYTSRNTQKHDATKSRRTKSRFRCRRRKPGDKKRFKRLCGLWLQTCPLNLSRDNYLLPLRRLQQGIFVSPLLRNNTKYVMNLTLRKHSHAKPCLCYQTCFSQ